MTTEPNDRPHVELKPDAGGLWQITTEASITVLDLDESRLLRAPGAAMGSHIASDGAHVLVHEQAGDGRWIPLRALLDCRVGCPLVVLCEPEPGRLVRRQTTYVQTIRRLTRTPTRHTQPDQTSDTPDDTSHERNDHA